MRNINTVAIVDGETREIIWRWGPTYLTFQHQPILLDNVEDRGCESGSGTG